MTDAHLDREVDAALDGHDDAALRDALDRAAKLQRRLDAVQALLAEERADAAEKVGGRTDYEEAAALRDDLAAVRAQLEALQKELRAVRSSSTWRAGLAVRRAAAPVAAVRRRTARTVRRLRRRRQGGGSRA